MLASEEQRLERIRRTWQAARVDDREVAAAYSRYRRRQAGPRRRASFVEFGVGFAVVALALVALRIGGLLGEGDAPRSAELATTVATIAARGAVEPVAPLAATAALPSPGTAPASAYSAMIERAGETVAIEPFVPYVVAEGERVVVRLGHELETIEGPRVLEFRLDPERASGWRMNQVEGPVGGAEAPAPPKPAPSRGESEPLVPPTREPSRPLVGAEFGAAPATPPQAEEHAQGSWTRAAVALRNGDTAQAEAALTELSETESASTRDSARLTLAQVYLSQGRDAEARALLTRLSESGATPFVRRRANELLAR